LAPLRFWFSPMDRLLSGSRWSQRLPWLAFVISSLTVPWICYSILQAPYPLPPYIQWSYGPTFWSQSIICILTFGLNLTFGDNHICLYYIHFFLEPIHDFMTFLSLDSRVWQIGSRNCKPCIPGNRTSNNFRVQHFNFHVSYDYSKFWGRFQKFACHCF
jgi:hypothetical protein